MNRARWYPKGAVVIAFEEAGLELGLAVRGELRNERNPYWAVGYYGKASRPAFNYVFPNAEALDRFVAYRYEAGLATLAARRERLAARRKVERSLAVGDVLRCSWGYEQTNVDYYEVVRLRGKRDLYIRPIAAEIEEERGMMSGTCTPKPGCYTGPEELKRDLGNGAVRITSYSSARKLEPVAEVAGARIFPTAGWSAYA